jgi:hypothetical protein
MKAFWYWAWEFDAGACYNALIVLLPHPCLNSLAAIQRTQADTSLSLVHKHRYAHELRWCETWIYPEDFIPGSYLIIYSLPCSKFQDNKNGNIELDYLQMSLYSLGIRNAWYVHDGSRHLKYQISIIDILIIIGCQVSSKAVVYSSVPIRRASS